MISLLPLALILIVPSIAHAHHDLAGQRARHAAAAAVGLVGKRQDPYPTGAGYDPLPLESVVPISDGAPNTEPTVPLPTTFPAGASNTLAGAPPLPTFSFDPAKWPGGYQIPAIDSDEVKGWLKELDGHTIPPYSLTTDSAACDKNPGPLAEAGADKRCWWTCGGCTRDTDITTCNDKMTWGLTFDDGPAFYTPKLLTWLESKSLKASFFLVGSNVIARPDMVQTEYMTGHQLCVHTWSHPALTTLTNEQIVAELGWTRKAIKDVTGVTPLFMRPPYGDIDDRVRAISNAMKLTPVIWTEVDQAGNQIEFDSQDWRVHAAGLTSVQAKQQLDTALDLAGNLTTGVVVLQHDLYQEAVDLAIGSTLPNAMQRGFTLQPVQTCQKKPMEGAYAETSGKSSPGSGNSTTSASGGSSASAGTGSGGGSATTSATTGTKTSAGPSGTTTGGAVVGVSMVKGGVVGGVAVVVVGMMMGMMI